MGTDLSLVGSHVIATHGEHAHSFATLEFRIVFTLLPLDRGLWTGADVLAGGCKGCGCRVTIGICFAGFELRDRFRARRIVDAAWCACANVIKQRVTLLNLGVELGCVALE